MVSGYLPTGYGTIYVPIHQVPTGLVGETAGQFDLKPKFYHRLRG